MVVACERQRDEWAVRGVLHTLCCCPKSWLTHHHDSIPENNHEQLGVPTGCPHFSQSLLFFQQAPHHRGGWWLRYSTTAADQRPQRRWGIALSISRCLRVWGLVQHEVVLAGLLDTYHTAKVLAVWADEYSWEDYHHKWCDHGKPHWFLDQLEESHFTEQHLTDIYQQIFTTLLSTVSTRERIWGRKCVWVHLPSDHTDRLPSYFPSVAIREASSCLANTSSASWTSSFSYRSQYSMSVHH